MNYKLVAGAAAFLTLLSILPGSELAGQGSGSNASSQPPAAKSADNTQAPLSPKDMQVERAKIYMATKRYEQAIETYTELAKAEPRNAQYPNMIGIAYLSLNQFSQARRYFTRALKADKKYVSALSNLGMTWYMQRDYRRAIREYQRAVAIAPAEANVYANLGYAYYHSKKDEEAGAAFRKALQLDPRVFEHTGGGVGTIVQDRTVADHGHFFFIMAREYAQIGDAEHCAEYLRKSADEGYKDVGKAKTDPAFTKVLADPAIQDFFLRYFPGGGKGSAPAPGA
jgi:tetratricopeptide (TPR) repeat protein